MLLPSCIFLYQNFIIPIEPVFGSLSFSNNVAGTLRKLARSLLILVASDDPRFLGGLPRMDNLNNWTHIVISLVYFHVSYKILHFEIL